MGVEIAVSDPGKIATRGVGGWCRVGGMRDTHALPKWRSHKVVEGFKITCIVLDQVPGGAAQLRGYDIRFDRKLQVLVLQPYVEKHAPRVGGYFVRYDDGYESFSPAAAFEGGYTSVDAELAGAANAGPENPSA